jgi:hypothetical protein
MKDMQTHLEEVRTNLAELIVLKGIVTDTGKSEEPARLAQSASGLASEIEKATAPAGPNVACAESQTVEFWNWVPAAVRKQAVVAEGAAGNNEDVAAVREQVIVANRERAGQSQGRLPWLLVIILVAMAGAFAIANNGAEEDWFSAPMVESKPVPLAEPRDEPKHAMAAPEALKDLESAELPSEQVAVLPAALGHADEAVAERASNLKNAPAEVVEPPTRRGVARPTRHQKSAISLQRRQSRSGWLLLGTGQGWRVVRRQAAYRSSYSSSSSAP